MGRVASMATVVGEGSESAVVCASCRLAVRPWARMRGLMFRARLVSGEGLLLEPAFSIHTFFMRFAIDAVFLDEEMRIVGVRERLRPWRAATVRGARSVLELPAGEIERRGLAIGERLKLT